MYPTIAAIHTKKTNQAKPPISISFVFLFILICSYKTWNYSGRSFSFCCFKYSMTLTFLTTTRKHNIAAIPFKSLKISGISSIKKQKTLDPQQRQKTVVLSLRNLILASQSGPCSYQTPLRTGRTLFIKITFCSRKATNFPV